MIWSENKACAYICRVVQDYRTEGNVAYKLQFPLEMSVIFDVFHVSQLKRCLRIPEEAIAPTNIKLQSDLTYEEKSIRVLEEMERVNQSKVIKFYKVV